MYSELGVNPKDPNSLFQKFLQNCPEALSHLFDSCLVAENNGNQKGKMNIDFFLFKTLGDSWFGSELTIINILFASRKYKLLDHPVVEILILLKWAKVWKLFSVILFMLFIHMMAILGYSVVNFSNLLPIECDEVQKKYWWHILNTTNSFLLLYQVFKLINFSIKIFQFKARISRYSFWKDEGELYEFVEIMFQTITPLLGILTLAFNSRNWTACLVLYGSFHFLMKMTLFPKFGENAFMTGQVMRTIAEFFFSYSAQIFSFALAFHILLPGSVTFGNLDNSLLKILTMLLGEFDFVTSILKDENTFWLTKVIFAMFLLSMSIVLMNLVVGLAIHDIGALRNIAHIRKIITLMVAIQKTENSIQCLRRIFPWIFKTEKECQEQIYMDLKNLDYTADNCIYVRKNTYDIQKFACPNSVFNKVVAITMKRFGKKVEIEKEESRHEELLMQILEKLESMDRKLEN